MVADERLFLLSEVAEKTGLSLRALADAARAGKMPHYKEHGRRYMSQAQIDDYLSRALVSPKSEPVNATRAADIEAAALKRLQDRMARQATRQSIRRSGAGPHQ